jgi:hypothetical protein
LQKKILDCMNLRACNLNIPNCAKQIASEKMKSVVSF